MNFPTNVSNLKKWITDNILLAFVAFLLFTIVIVMIATIFSYGIVLIFGYSNQNYTLDNYTSFINQNSSDFVSIFVNTMLTLGLIVFSGLSLSSAQDALRQSRKEQQIKDIENRLEKFYIPADDIINDQFNQTKYVTLNGHPSSKNGVIPSQVGLKHLKKYSYLADKKTYEVYEAYINSNCTSIKPTTCQDKYGDFTFCEHHKDVCHNQWNTCPYNLEYCKYHPDPGENYNDKRKVDHTKCVFDNTNCKYYIELKDVITADIQKYKERLSELKE